MDTIAKKYKNALSGSKKIIGINGSPRKNGNSDILLKQILKGAKETNVSAKRIYLRDFQFQSCAGCEKCRKDKICTGLNDGMTLLYPKIIESQGLVIISPTHNYNVTALIKAFIDRLYCFYNFTKDRPGPWSSNLAGQGRKAVLIAVCEQKSKKDMGFTLDAMRLPIKALGFDIIAELPVLKVFDRGKIRENKEILAKALKLGKNLATLLNK